MLAVGAAVLSDVLDNTIRDPEMAQRLLNAEVVGSLPLVKDWKRKALPTARKKSGSTALVKAESPVPALLSPTSKASRSFEEAVRTLRNSILLTSFDRPLKSILLTSATPGEGKTTAAIHLAIAHAQQKLKTLLIDADLRRPGIARTLGLQPADGLAAILNNGMLWREKLTQLEMATCVDGVVVVTVAGQTNRKAIASVMATLQRLRANVVGLVLNEVTHEMSDSYYYYGYYNKKYKYYKHAGAEDQA